MTVEGYRWDLTSLPHRLKNLPLDQLKTLCRQRGIEIKKKQHGGTYAKELKKWKVNPWNGYSSPPVSESADAEADDGEESDQEGDDDDDGCAAAAAQPKEKSDLTSQHAIKNSQVTDNAANTDVGVGDGGGGDDGDDDEAEAEAEGEGDGEGEPTAMRQKAAAANIVWTWLNHLQPRSASKLGCSLSDMCEAKNLDGHGTSEKLVARLIANGGPKAAQLDMVCDAVGVGKSGGRALVAKRLSSYFAEAAAKAAAEAHAGLTLSAADQAMLDGAHGRAAQVAMKIVARVAVLQHATELVDITQVHIDGCIYVGPASLRFAQQMLALGGATSLKPPYYTSLPHTLTTPPYYTPLPHPLITPPYYPLTRWRRARADDAQCDLGRPAEMARARGAHVAR